MGRTPSVVHKGDGLIHQLVIGRFRASHFAKALDLHLCEGGVASSLPPLSNGILQVLRLLPQLLQFVHLAQRLFCSLGKL